MSKLLPPNATALEHNLAEVNERLGDLPVNLHTLIQPDACPSQFLPWLAQQLSVDNWDMDWSEQQRRDTIKSSLNVHRVKGTIGAVRRALGALGFTTRLQEWFNQIPQGRPYTYRLLLDVNQVGIDKAGLEKIFSVVGRTKNLRSHLDSAQITIASKSSMRVASAAGIGHEISVGYHGPSDLWLLMEGAKNGDAATEAAVDSLHTVLHATRPTAEYYEAAIDTLHTLVNTTLPKPNYW